MQISKSFDSSEAGGGQSALFHGPGGEEPVFFGDGQFAVGFLLFVGHGGGDILQGRAYFPFDFEGRVEVGGGEFILLVFLDGHVGGFLRFFGHDPHVELADAIAHDVQFFVFFRAFVLLLHDPFEAAGEFNEEVGTGVVLLVELHELCDVDGGREELLGVVLGSRTDRLDALDVVVLEGALELFKRRRGVEHW